MESAAVIVDESEVTDIRLLQSTACAAPHMPSAPPINTALVRNTVRAASLNLVFAFIQMSPRWVYVRGFARTTRIPIAGRAPLTQGRSPCLIHRTELSSIARPSVSTKRAAIGVPRKVAFACAQVGLPSGLGALRVGAGWYMILSGRLSRSDMAVASVLLL